MASYNINKIVLPNGDNVSLRDTTKLPKITYEWNKAISFGGSGFLKIGSFPMYDTNLTIEINSTTSKTYHGTVVIATQNVSTTSIGSAHNVRVYDDPTGIISNSLRVVWESGSRNYNVYFVPQAWSKNFIHIKALGNYMDGATDICISQTGTAPTTTTGLEPLNISPASYMCLCSTAAGTAAKVAEMADETRSFVLREGVIIGVQFLNSNTQTDTSAHPITLNVCGTGAFRIIYGDGNYQLTNNQRLFGYADRVIYYIYHVGTWTWLSCSWGPYDAMTQQEASAGSVAEDRVISPKVLHDSILEQTTPIEGAVNDIAMDGTKNKLQNTASSTGIFTVYDDGTVKATVPASNSQTSLALYTADNDISFDHDMVLSGCPADGSYVYKYAIYLLDANGNIVMIGEDGMADEGITRVIPAGTAFRSVRILIRANIGAQTLTFKPMLCDKDLYSMSPDYIPYAPSNRELYEADKALDQIKFTPETSAPTSSQRLLFTSPRSNNNLTMLVGKLDSSTNYVQFYVNGIDKGYIKFDVSRNINIWQ
jgi:hypothetical protein